MTTHTLYDACSKLFLVLCVTRIARRRFTFELPHLRVSPKRSRTYTPQVLSSSISLYVVTVIAVRLPCLMSPAPSLLIACFLSRRLFLSGARSSLQCLLATVRV